MMGFFYSAKKKISKCRKFISRLRRHSKKRRRSLPSLCAGVFWPGVVRSVLGKVREKRQRTVHTPAELCVQQTRKKKSSFFFFQSLMSLNLILFTQKFFGDIQVKPSSSYFVQRHFLLVHFHFNRLRLTSEIK